MSNMIWILLPLLTLNSNSLHQQILRAKRKLVEDIYTNCGKFKTTSSFQHEGASSGGST